MGDSVHIRPDYTTDNIDKPFILEGRRAVHSITLADALLAALSKGQEHE